MELTLGANVSEVATCAWAVPVPVGVGARGGGVDLAVSYLRPSSPQMSNRMISWRADSACFTPSIWHGERNPPVTHVLSHTLCALVSRQHSARVSPVGLMLRVCFARVVVSRLIDRGPGVWADQAVARFSTRRQTGSWKARASTKAPTQRRRRAQTGRRLSRPQRGSAAPGRAASGGTVRRAQPARSMPPTRSPVPRRTPTTCSGSP